MQITSFQVSELLYATVGAFGSPPESPRSPRSVPTVGGCAVHRHCCVVILGNLLLNSQLLITLVFLFPADVGDACFLVFIHVENASIYGCTLDLVRWQGSKDLLLLRRLRCARAESSRAEQGCCIS